MSLKSGMGVSKSGVDSNWNHSDYCNQHLIQLIPIITRLIYFGIKLASVVNIERPREGGTLSMEHVWQRTERPTLGDGYKKLALALEGRGICSHRGSGNQ